MSVSEYPPTRGERRDRKKQKGRKMKYSGKSVRRLQEIIIEKSKAGSPIALGDEGEEEELEYTV